MSPALTGSETPQPIAYPSPNLTKRGRECLSLRGHGAIGGEISDRLCIDVSTVCGHLDQAKLRLGTKSRECADNPGAAARRIGQ